MTAQNLPEHLLREALDLVKKHPSRLAAAKNATRLDGKKGLAPRSFAHRLEAADLDGLGRECLRAVLEAFAGNVSDDPTRGARHYYAPKAMPTPPAWAVGHQPSAIIQDHYFFTGVQ